MKEIFNKLSTTTGICFIIALALVIAQKVLAVPKQPVHCNSHITYDYPELSKDDSGDLYYDDYLCVPLNDISSYEGH